MAKANMNHHRTFMNGSLDGKFLNHLYSSFSASDDKTDGALSYRSSGFSEYLKNCWDKSHIDRNIDLADDFIKANPKCETQNYFALKEHSIYNALVNTKHCGFSNDVIRLIKKRYKNIDATNYFSYSINMNNKIQLVGLFI